MAFSPQLGEWQPRHGVAADVPLRVWIALIAPATDYLRGDTPPAEPSAKPEKIPPPRALPDGDEPANLSRAPSSLPEYPEEQPIDLDTALRLAEVENPTIGIARQAIEAALADQLRARAMMLPHLRAGMNYHLHNGILQNSFGEMRRVDSQSFYLGGGARALASDTVAFPAVQIYSHLGDAIFEPLARAGLSPRTALARPPSPTTCCCKLPSAISSWFVRSRGARR